MKIGDVFFYYELKIPAYEFENKQYRDIGIIVDDKNGVFFNIFKGLDTAEIDKNKIILTNVFELSEININNIFDIYEKILRCEEYDTNKYHPFYYNFPLFWDIYNGSNITKLKQHKINIERYLKLKRISQI